MRIITSLTRMSFLQICHDILIYNILSSISIYTGHESLSNGSQALKQIESYKKYILLLYFTSQTSNVVLTHLKQGCLYIFVLFINCSCCVIIFIYMNV